MKRVDEGRGVGAGFGSADARWARAAERVYRFMTGSRPEEWGDHEWTDWAMNIDRWDWNSGVGVIAAAEYGIGSGRSEVLGEVERWVERNRRLSESVSTINGMAPFAVFPSLFRLTGKEEYADKTKEVAQRMIERFPRTGSGAFEHTVTENASFREQIWADTVFMAVLFLARAGRLLSDRRLTDEALRQTLLHLEALQDEGTGLLYHAWNCEKGNWMSSAKWNRANAWNVCAVPMIWEEAEGAGGDSAILREIGARYRKLAEAVIARQNPGGLWPTVLDRPDFAEETSGSAGLACGIYKAVRLGLAPAGARAHADRAAKAVLARIAENGAALGVSGGTPVLDSVEAYNLVPTFPTLYGQGLTLMLLAEAGANASGA